MKTEMQTAELVTIEDASLETVSGGVAITDLVDITKTVQVALDATDQSNALNFQDVNVLALGPAIFQFTQQNVDDAG